MKSIYRDQYVVVGNSDMQQQQDSVTGQEKARNNFAREQIASHVNRAP